MGLFDLFKKKEDKKGTVRNSDTLYEDNFTIHISSDLLKPTAENALKFSEWAAVPDEDIEHLTPDGALPWGWHSANKDIIEKAQTEYTYFLNKWIDARNKSPKELYSALKSFILYLEELQDFCKQKGECFEFYFDKIIASSDYIEKRKAELQHLINNFDEIQYEYDKKTTYMSVFDDAAIESLLQEYDGILQSDFIKMFDDCIQSEVGSKLYFMEKTGELERTKSGRSYILHYKK